jgi:hypothetical protein
VNTEIIISNFEELQAMIEQDKVREITETKYKRYYIERLANVYSVTKIGHNVKKLKPMINTNGYVRYHINKKNLRAHRLVYEAYKGKIPQGYCINHIDGNKVNNRCTDDDTNNLEVVTIADNNKHAIETGLNQFKTLTLEQRESIVNQYEQDKDQSVLSISRELNISYEKTRRFIKSYEKQRAKQLIEIELNKGKAIIEMNRNQLQIVNTLSTQERIRVKVKHKTQKDNEETN